MIILGMLIGDRYEILDKIGTGGMSDVYKAKDHKLNRFVAVKVLKQEFSENTNFVSKFRMEAQAAAGLMHPNIVNVYDVGEEEGISYIVMELVEGITLKHYIEKKARLSTKEAISIAIQVSMGIEAAHNNHIIHRDIKPQNIIISRDGKVKVTDFGIAKAATSNTITSNVMGSVHYTSPEQARGGFSDEKSDIYSLGCTMYEMLTGHVPFDGETTVAIAIKHIQDDIPSPREYVPEIPVCVEKIIFKCTQKSPDRRYQKVGDLVKDLKRSLVTPDEDFVELVDVDAYAATKAITDDEMAAIKERTGSIMVDEVHMRLNEEQPAKPKKATMQIVNIPLTNSNASDEDEEEDDDQYDTYDTYDTYDNDEYYEDEEEDDDDNYNDDDYDDRDSDPKMERLTTILAVCAAVVIGLLLIVVVWKVVSGLGNTSSSSTTDVEAEDMVTIANYVGLSSEDAKAKIEELGLIAEVAYDTVEGAVPGVVLSQSEPDGTQLAKGSRLVITVNNSDGETEVAATVPDVRGKNQAEAQQVLELAGYSVLVENVNSDSVNEGYVIEQTTTGDGKTIILRVSLGPETKKVEVPNLVGLTESAAKDKLTSAKLTAGTVSEDYSESVEKGLVISQSISSGSSIGEGASVNFVISLGKKEVTYICNTAVSAPAGYVEGMEVTIKLSTADGFSKVYTTTSFPFTINETGLKSENGTISITGVKKEVQEVDTGEVDELGNRITKPVETEVQVDFGSQTVTFSKPQ